MGGSGAHPDLIGTAIFVLYLIDGEYVRSAGLFERRATINDLKTHLPNLWCEKCKGLVNDYYFERFEKDEEFDEHTLVGCRVCGGMIGEIRE